MGIGIRLAALAALIAHTACLPAEWGANAILHPYRRRVTGRPSVPHEDFSFASEGVTIRGWRFPAEAPRRGAIV
jgi:hypothetical protein